MMTSAVTLKNPSSPITSPGVAALKAARRSASFVPGEGRWGRDDTHGTPPLQGATFQKEACHSGRQEKVKRGYCAGATSPAARTLRSSAFPSIT